MMIDPQIFWFVLAVTMIAMEVVLGMTVVLLSSGLAAFAVGLLIINNVIPQYEGVWQAAAFCGMTIVWCLFLWRPMKKILRQRVHAKAAYSNIVGQNVILSQTLIKGDVGNVEWSGTIFKAQMADDCDVAQIDPKKHATIVAVKNNVLIIKNI